MDYTYGMQEASAASAAIKALQLELREMRYENKELKSELHNLNLSQSSLKENFEKQLERIKNEYSNKESGMKDDLIYLCQRIKHLEQENFNLTDENQKIKESLMEGKQNQRMIILLQDEISMLNKKLQQRENEQELLYKRISQLENISKESPKESQIFTQDNLRTSRNHAASPNEEKAESLDNVLSKQKIQYREYLKTPNPSSSEWKQRVDELRRSIESNSQELLRLRKEQYEQLKQL